MNSNIPFIVLKIIKRKATTQNEIYSLLGAQWSADFLSCTPIPSYCLHWEAEQLLLTPYNFGGCSQLDSHFHHMLHPGLLTSHEVWAPSKDCRASFISTCPRVWGLEDCGIFPPNCVLLCRCLWVQTERMILASCYQTCVGTPWEHIWNPTLSDTRKRLQLIYPWWLLPTITLGGLIVGVRDTHGSCDV